MSGAQQHGNTDPVLPGLPPTVTMLEAARRRAHRVLVTEQVARRLIPALSVLLLYVLATLLRVPQQLPDWLHGLVELACLAGTGLLARRGLRGYQPPTGAAADQRIEQASGLRNRPLASLTDRSAGIGSGALWSAYQSRLVAALGPLRTGWPQLRFASGDPWRAALLLVPAVVIAAALAGSHAPGRIEAGFVPGWDDPDVPMPHVEAWITPPAYAPSAPVFLSQTGSPGATAPGSVPQGAVLTATVTGLHGAPELSGHLGGQTLKALDRRSWRVEGKLESSGVLALRARGRTIARWDITVAPDSVPSVKWGKDPGGEKGGRRTRIPFEAHHAYGIASLVVEMRLAHPSFLAKKRVLRIPLPLSGHPIDAKGTATPDLSSDPWAGEQVSAVLVATSVSHQEGRSQAVTFTLGSQQFKSPVARAVLDLRKRLALGSESRSAAAEDLAALGETPGPIAENTGMFLNLTATASLLEDQDVADDAARDEAVGRLWDLALDIEDRLHGGSEGALASIDVRAAQEAVEQQLRHMREDNAHGPQEQAELQRRMQALRQAISRKMQALAQQAMRDGTAVPDLPGLSKNGDRAFQQLMKQLQDDAAEGREGASDKLQQLEDSIERMRNATPQDLAQMAQQMQAQQKLQEQEAGLQDLVKQQTSLLDHAQSRIDKTHRADATRRDRMTPPDEDGDQDLSTMSTQDLLRKLGLVPPPGEEGSEPQPGQNAQPAPRPNGQGQNDQGQNAQEGDSSQPRPAENSDAAKATSAEQQQADRASQHALMRATDELSQEFKELTGKTPPAFAKAQADMKDARHALAQNNDSQAVTAQQKALQDLRQSRQQMKQSLQSKGGGSGATSFVPSFGGGHGSGNDQSGSGDSGDDGDDGSDEGSGSDQNADRDPLGRATGEGNDSGTNQGGHIPDAMSRERAHEIEEELRRRDSDRTRPPQELEYLDRLLKSF
ncbi:DUF4175 domain-containing protein [Acetobacter oeni]|uniref:Membrane protein n=2 Tax=Acetobacter oeni TaxID=304077 RepID=A0A511XIF9_9PROT|nr:DUF4175 family protein [Acetobacter oeni]MBB3881455.1 uncharacterized protein (TIGR02302 family) [Acetobacter oeni]NHO18320.1 DUF4175 family protein [Acetobacter oeni]GBR10936.1 hypothetical protein AA21952_3215 [Acetobacter oeni LMG 21952]GEN62732.1 membrane protein [Acetobacter oeni]